MLRYSLRHLLRQFSVEIHGVIWRNVINNTRKTGQHGDLLSYIEIYKTG